MLGGVAAPQPITQNDNKNVKYLKNKEWGGRIEKYPDNIGYLYFNIPVDWAIVIKGGLGNNFLRDFQLPWPCNFKKEAAIRQRPFGYFDTITGTIFSLHKFIEIDIYTIFVQPITIPIRYFFLDNIVSIDIVIKIKILS